ncbi:MAG: polyribonucleotide nucleotidyltransferase, partial [Succiniclasticum sp.]|nr:polyribonucleotide nucleotidyltransferase [Succiniclasticum sp.]
MNSYTMDLGGRPLTLEFGEVCKQASGGVLVRYGDTVVVVAATGTKTPREGVDFFPLTVDFEEKMYAVGKLPGGFIKREGRPSTHAILTSRLIDRPIRPMFPDGYHNDVQIVATAVSVDPDNAPDIPAMIGASAALCVSDIPFEGPIAGVRVGLIDGQFIVNPTPAQFEVSRLNLAVAGTDDAILMVEAGSKEISEQEMLDAIFFAHDKIKTICAFISKIRAEIGKPKMEVPVYNPPEELANEIEAYGSEKLKAALMDANKLEREENVDKVKKEIAEVFLEKYPENGTDVAYITQKLVKKIVRRTIAVDKIRPDGRALDEVRPVTCRVGLLPRVHGSSLFTRGQTQILNACTLAPLRDAQVIEGLGPEEMQRYIHQYNFPPYSVGETKPLRSPGRREIGHGAL